MDYRVKLHNQVAEVAPIDGISIGRRDDKTTWRIDFQTEATKAQRKAAQAVVDAFDADAEIEAVQYIKDRADAGIGSKDGEQLDAMSTQRQRQKELVDQARVAIKKGDTAAALAFVLDALTPTNELDALDAWRMTIKEDNPKE